MMERKFIGRENELRALQEKFERPGFQLAVIYGRRRIGKTTLVNKFIENNADVKAVEFVAVERNEKELLKMMTNAVLGAVAPALTGAISFESFDKLFDFIGEAAKNERIIFFIDEYPYLANECRYMNSLLQKYIDRNWRETGLFVILCGSLIHFMKEDVLSESAPLHGRSDLELKLRPFDYYETGLFLPGYSCEDRALAYGVTGGVAKYIEQIDPEKTMEQNIIDEFYRSTGYFTEDQVRTAITGDRKKPSAYNSIIAAIAGGRTKYSEIASYAGIGDISFFLKNLQQSEVIEKRTSGKPYYRVTDGMVNFWFRFVSDAASLINAGRGDLYYRNAVKNALHQYMGSVFEDMARQFIFRNMGTERVPYFVTSADEFQKSVREDGDIRQIEIDLLGMNGKDIVFAGECKFRNQKFAEEGLTRFRDKIRYLPATDPALLVFSLSGFTPGVLSSAKAARLFTIEDMYR